MSSRCKCIYLFCVWNIWTNTVNRSFVHQIYVWGKDGICIGHAIKTWIRIIYIYIYVYLHVNIVCANLGLGSSYEDFWSRMVRDSLCLVDIHEPWTKETNSLWCGYICRSILSLADMKPEYKVTRIHPTSSITTQRMDTIQVNKGGKPVSQKAMLPVLSSKDFSQWHNGPTCK